jgi:hypothetical protein
MLEKKDLSQILYVKYELSTFKDKLVAHGKRQLLATTLARGYFTTYIFGDGDYHASISDSGERGQWLHVLGAILLERYDHAFKCVPDYETIDGFACTFKDNYVTEVVCPMDPEDFHYQFERDPNASSRDAWDMLGRAECNVEGVTFIDYVNVGQLMSMRSAGPVSQEDKAAYEIIASNWLNQHRERCKAWRKGDKLNFEPI